jgi:putative transposase
VATRTSGSEERTEETTGRNTGNAPRSDSHHFKMHPGASCEPVLVAWGMTIDGKPVLVSIEPGATESTDAWRGFLVGMVERGLRPATLVVSDGGAGLISAVELVYPASAGPRCLIHRARNLLAKVPKHAQGQVKAEFWAIWDRIDADAADR